MIRAPEPLSDAHALDNPAKIFYERLGFYPSPLDPMTLLITLADLRASLSSAPKESTTG